MELPAWFRSAVEQRMDGVLARIEQRAELQQYRNEEEEAWEILFAALDKSYYPRNAGWGAVDSSVVK